jgi:rod shape determining protein RodA
MFPVTSSSDQRFSPTSSGGVSLRDLDWVLLAAALAATILGAMLVWSASLADLASPTDPQSYLKKHVINIVLGLALGYVASRLDYRWLRAYTPVIYAISTVSLLLVFVPGLGTKIAGARAWIQLPGGFTIQPSEFVKIAVILMMAVILSEKDRADEEPADKDVMFALGVAVVPLLIILVQNDTGSVLILGSVALAVIAVSGARTKWLIGLLLSSIFGVLIAIQLGLLKQYQVDRLTSFINPTADASSIAYNSTQARIAIGGGGWFGFGLERVQAFKLGDELSDLVTEGFWCNGAREVVNPAPVDFTRCFMETEPRCRGLWGVVTLHDL